MAFAGRLEEIISERPLIAENLESVARDISAGDFSDDSLSDAAPALLAILASAARDLGPEGDDDGSGDEKSNIIKCSIALCDIAGLLLRGQSRGEIMLFAGSLRGEAETCEICAQDGNGTVSDLEAAAFGGVPQSRRAIFRHPSHPPACAGPVSTSDGHRHKGNATSDRPCGCTAVPSLAIALLCVTALTRLLDTLGASATPRAASTANNLASAALAIESAGAIGNREIETWNRMAKDCSLTAQMLLEKAVDNWREANGDKDKEPPHGTRLSVLSIAMGVAAWEMAHSSDLGGSRKATDGPTHAMDAVGRVFTSSPGFVHETALFLDLCGGTDPATPRVGNEPDFPRRVFPLSHCARAGLSAVWIRHRAAISLSLSLSRAFSAAVSLSALGEVLAPLCAVPFSSTFVPVEITRGINGIKDISPHGNTKGEIEVSPGMRCAEEAVEAMEGMPAGTFVPCPTSVLVSLLAVFTRAGDRSTSNSARLLFQRLTKAIPPADALSALYDITVSFATTSSASFVDEVCRSVRRSLVDAVNGTDLDLPLGHARSLALGLLELGSSGKPPRIEAIASSLSVVKLLMSHVLLRPACDSEELSEALMIAAQTVHGIEQAGGPRSMEAGMIGARLDDIRNDLAKMRSGDGNQS